MDAKFYIKSLNSSHNGEGSKGVEGNSEGLLTIHTTPSYIHILVSKDKSLINTVIAIDDIKKSPIKDKNFLGRLLYKEEPIPLSDLVTINFDSVFHIEPIISLNLQAIKIKDIDNTYNIPQEIKDEFGDYYVILESNNGSMG